MWYEVVEHHRLPESLGGERQFEKAIAGTISEYTAILCVQSMRETNSNFEELKDDTLVSASVTSRTSQHGWMKTAKATLERKSFSTLKRSNLNV